MIRLLPECCVPSRYQREERRYWNEAVSMLILLAAGVVYSVCAGDISFGIMPGWWEKLRLMLHGVPMCPLCGATRSFFYMCRGEWLTALHFSFFGVFFFFCAIIHGVFKALYLYCRPALLARIFPVMDGNAIILIPLFVLWAVQLLLHYTGIFLWYSPAHAGL